MKTLYDLNEVAESNKKYTPNRKYTPKDRKPYELINYKSIYDLSKIPK